MLLAFFFGKKETESQGRAQYCNPQGTRGAVTQLISHSKKISGFPQRAFHLLTATNILARWAKTKCQSCLRRELHVCLRWQGRYQRKSVCFMQNNMMSDGKKSTFKLKELKHHNVGEPHNLVKHNEIPDRRCAMPLISFHASLSDHCWKLAILVSVTFLALNTSTKTVDWQILFFYPSVSAVFTFTAHFIQVL